jgi:hypothetical protein
MKYQWLMAVMEGKEKKLQRINYITGADVSVDGGGHRER